MYALLLLGLAGAAACDDGVAPEALSPAVASMDVISGNSQTALAGTELTEALVVRALSATGRPLAGQIVNFRVTQGGGSVYAGSALTNAYGVAQERWTLGSTPGVPQAVEARAVDSTTGEKRVFATFTATAIDPARTVASVAVLPLSTALSVGDTRQLTATARNAEGGTVSGKSFAWTSSNTAVATVSGTGLVTARATGSAVITATVDGLSGSATLAIGPSNNNAPLPENPGTPAITTARVSADSFSVTATWTASRGSVAYGWMTGSNNGPYSAQGQVSTTTVTFQARHLASPDGYWLCVVGTDAAGKAVTAPTCTTYASPGVPSTPPPAPVVAVTVSVTPASGTLIVNATQQLSATARDASGGVLSGKTVTWSSSNTSVATVSSTGLVTARSSGSATISATVDGRTGTADLTVTRSPSSTPTGSSQAPQVADRILFDFRSSLQQATSQQAALDLVSQERNGALAFTTDVDGKGTNAIRVDWSRMTTCDDQAAILIMRFPRSEPMPRRAFVQWKQRMGRTSTGGGRGNIDSFQVTNGACGNAGRKVALMMRDVPGDGAQDRIEYIWPGPSPAMPTITVDARSHRWGLNRGISFEPQQHVGETITHTLYYQAESSEGANDGVVRMWINGQLVAEHTGLDLGPQGFNRFQLPTTFRAPSQDQSEYIWDMVAWEPR